MHFLDYAQMLFALIATLALIGLAAYAARRYGLMQLGTIGAVRRMKIAETLMLDARRRLVLVKLDGREHMLLLSPTGDAIITEVEARPDPPPPVPLKSPLKSPLQSLLKSKTEGAA